MEGGALTALRSLRLVVVRRNVVGRLSLRATWVPSLRSPCAGWRASGASQKYSGVIAALAGRELA